MHLPKLLLRHIIRRAAQKILCRAAHRESDDFTDILFSPEKHNHEVDSRRHARMRRRAELKCVIYRA